MPIHALRSITLTLVLAFFYAITRAEPIAVRQTQGTTHGFLLMRSANGKILAHGELIQVAHGEQLSTRLVYRFADGSVDDETTTFVQHGDFRLVREHHIQKGRFFPKMVDYLVDVPTGNVTSRTFDKDGKMKVDVQHIDLPSDVYNGLIATILLNAPRNASGFKVSLVAPTGKGRLIKLAITPDGQAAFQEAGIPYKATIYRLKPEIGGVAGVIAPIIGKQPPDTLVWILPGQSPSFIREIAQIYPDGPTVSVELSGASFPRLASMNP